MRIQELAALRQRFRFGPHDFDFGKVDSRVSDETLFDAEQQLALDLNTGRPDQKILDVDDSAADAVLDRRYRLIHFAFFERTQYAVHFRVADALPAIRCVDMASLIGKGALGSEI